MAAQPGKVYIDGWSLDSLQAYFDARCDGLVERIDAVDKRYADRIEDVKLSVRLSQEATNTATSKAEHAQERHNTAANEWRGQC